MSTESLLREILQEIREVKAHVIPAPATRHSVLASAGGGPSIQNLISHATASERAGLQSLLGPASAKRPNKVEVDLYYNEELDAFISLDGSVYYADLDDHTLTPIPKMDRRIGMLKPGVRRETATPSDFEFCPEDGPSAGGGLNEERNKRLMCRMSKEEQTSLSKEDKKRRAELKKLASEERKASRSPEEKAKINARVAAMQAGRASKKSAGGEPYAEEGEASEERQTRKRKNRQNRTRKN